MNVIGNGVVVNINAKQIVLAFYSLEVYSQ